jgi:hypothetical protein
MRLRRLLIDSITAALLGCAFACAGWLLADPLLRAVLGAAGVERVALLDPADPIRARLLLAAACALPALWGWLAALVERLIARADPAPARLALLLALPAAGAGLGLLKADLWLGRTMAAAREGSQLPPLIALRDVAGELGWTALRWGALVGLLLVVGVAALAHRRQARQRGITPPAASDRRRS